MKTKQNKLVDLEEFINEEYGKRGSTNREIFEEGYDAFKIGVMLQKMRKEHNMTQEQLALKCGITKNYISRIENNNSDIRLSILIKIFREGFCKHLKLLVDI